ncbi:2-keto-4-pentenoate hydratase/2-oxohepta-3-ene-1,7-dioic acid hydratase in catechol pathway [Amycolatopsis sulphurea]|uniref:2-keto-4-pentenoate hydratase/2-oxohepta-3-ene-1,7-dioic acid hydratase in catechol pathway n=1 Tax=Amycolatopsis sulphurea TaxID=76022 RepID=A0A2A9FGC2_9PSEU|nr:fumarylacetoacetate hydrolase family protein [Amycolatopsis sulphurea]PFG49973.1 2-keto-4-pentenoate hydratase/2-oxohepta-3-ene-1,7-dioic acid hydratase in catechol pathway [Amycolatopsis sulphurea]
MRFVTYESPGGGDRAGVVDEGRVCGFEPGLTLLDLLERGDAVRDAERVVASASEVVPLREATLRAPLEPRSVRDCAGFLQHLRNLSATADMPVDDRHLQFPPFYFSNPAAVIGPYDDVPIAPDSTMFDYELEIAAVIGKAGANIPLAQAEEHIAGYLILCDWSARDLQLNEMPLRLGPGKGKDTANTLGPMLVTPDELEPFRAGHAFDLEMTGYVNGELVTRGRWSTIDWGFADMITYVSRGTNLRAGDVIGSGTVETGCLFEHYSIDPRNFRGWLQPGDEVRLVVEQLGELRQRVVEGVKAERLSSGY